MAMQTDFLVIGSGLAGLNAALHLAEHGRVMMLCKRGPSESNTAYAQGGLASVMDEHDSFEAHVEDTLKAGGGLCNRQVVEAIVEAGPSAVERLVSRGVRFDAQNGSFDLTREGGHSSRRILHAQDITGREIDRAMRKAIAGNPNITLLQDHVAVDLITPSALKEPRCLGAYILDSNTGSMLTVEAKATLLATGGAGKAYLYTSNPDVSTGDGVAMAFRAGATISNMEFFQFHPTCLYHPEAKSFLISEALRGEGGILKRDDGTAFMAGVHPMADLAPRDIVARAIDREMKRTGDDHVGLDMTSHNPAFVASRFPNIHTACLALGIDMTRQPIPVVPAAHYMCGGVASTPRGKTDIQGLWVAGESASTGLHGANRLASNSLLEASVVSEWAAEDMAGYAKATDFTGNVHEWDVGQAIHPDEQVVVSHNWDELRRLMWNYVGIVRSDKRLERARKRVALLQEEIHEYYWNFHLTIDLIELRNLATVSQLIIGCALRRRESRGLHFSIDTPDILDTPFNNTVKQTDRNTWAWDKVPVPQ
ncbi:MAG: L-aspartate oxidase [Deltaproteobacteria bacterium]|jgi:L-aspartate oxidase|nr:L-aspartate oxidase [Deltaproteobacteria bacterium]MBT6434617.1 L-aspartate oxidase [Deltaproteobacteria bacterium]MBT6489965.1 L-aspartate oxidase [Deltaproteobacteria bacterium]